jgi:hypothetical protein
MKVPNFLIFALFGICFAAPAPSDGLTGAAHPLSAGVIVPSAVNNTVTTLDAPFEAPVRKLQDVTPDRAMPANLYRVDITFSEYCDDGSLKARGWMGNGQVKFELYLHDRQVSTINLHPGYDQILGPYNFDAHTFTIEYDGCKWTSDGGYPCGWCETHPWSLGPLDCKTGQPGSQRVGIDIPF